MKPLLIKDVDVIITMDDERRELQDHSILIENGFITAIDAHIEEEKGWEVRDGRGYWVFPGLINTHHHLYQTLTRCVPEVQEAQLFQWLKTLYPIWARLTPEGVGTGARLGLGELLKSGCTTAVDHHYVFPRRVSPYLIDVQIEAARELGIRFHPCRGSMSRGEKEGGLPPDSVVQDEETILKDCLRLIKEYHDPQPNSMCQIVLAPCSPFSVTPSLMEDTIALAREYGIYCHTHLAETMDEEEYCLETLGLRPLEFMEKTGWLGRDVWFAHGIHFQEEELEVLARTQTGVAHCPVSNQKLSSGVAKIPRMLALGVPLGLAVDGSASNDSSNMMGEMKAALLIHKLYWGIDSVSARDILTMATRGGADLLGREDLGSLEPGKAGDLFMVKKNRLGFAGAGSDPITALIACGDTLQVDCTIVRGRVVVEEGRLQHVDEEALAWEGHSLSRQMLGKEENR